MCEGNAANGAPARATILLSLVFEAEQKKSKKNQKFLNVFFFQNKHKSARSFLAFSASFEDNSPCFVGGSVTPSNGQKILKEEYIKF